MAKTVSFDFGIPQSPNYTSMFWSGYGSGSTIAVILGGTPVPLIQSTASGITFTGNDMLTIQTAGTYLISYKINTTASLLMSAAVYQNGVAIPSLVSNPGIASSTFSSQAIAILSTGDTLELVLYGLLGTAVLVGGAGATLNIVRIA